MATKQVTKASAVTWTESHPWGDFRPLVGATDAAGSTYLVAPAHTNGQVTVTFATATAGVLTLIGPDDEETGGGGNLDLPAPSASAAIPPHENAVLVEIAAPGEITRTGETADSGDSLWIGHAAGYLKRSSRILVSNGQQITVNADTFWIRDLQGVPVVETPGARWSSTTVVVDDMRTGTAVRRRFLVRGMEHRGTGLQHVDSVRLDLGDEQTV